MNKSELIKFIENKEKSSSRYRKVYIDKNYDKRFKRIFEDFNISGFNEFTTVKEIYNYLHNTSEFCYKCKSNLYFNSFSHGYKECEKCKVITQNELIKDKKKLYKFLVDKPIFVAGKLKNSHDRACSYLKTNYRCIYEFLNDNIKRFDTKNLYDFLNGNEICKIKNCTYEARFISFSRGYKMFCSDNCRNNWWSEKQKTDNTVHKIKDVSGWRDKLSKSLKEKIKCGEFNPCVTNSWARSKINVNVKKDGKNITVPVRSSFEALFQILNPDCEYEKLRLPYKYKNKNHTYIVDFIDYENKMVYEVKPSTLINNEKNLIKESALIKWCNENNYKYKIITEKWVSENYDIDILEGQQDFNKLKRLLPRYEVKEN